MADFKEQCRTISSWYLGYSEKQKDSLLKELFLMSDNTEFVKKWMGNLADMQICKVDMLERLPDDIILMILQKLPLENIFMCRLVSKEWEKRISNNRIWFDLCTRAQFKVPKGLNPVQYMRTFLYLRDRILNMQDHVETLEITGAPAECKRKITPTTLKYKFGKLVYSIGTYQESDPVEYLCLLNGYDFSVIFQTKINYRPEKLELCENYIVGAELGQNEDNEGEEDYDSMYTMYVHSAVDGHLIYSKRIQLSEPDWEALRTLDCNEELGIILFITGQLSEIRRLSDGEKLCSLNNTQEHLGFNNKLAVPNGSNVRYYFVFSTSCCGDVIVSILDRRTHQLLHEQIIYARPLNFEDLIDEYEIATYVEENNLFLRILVFSEEADCSDRLNILTYKMPSAEPAAHLDLSNSLVHRDVLLHSNELHRERIAALPQYKQKLIKEKSAIKGSHMIAAGRSYCLISQGNLDHTMSLYCAKYGPANNPLAERDGPVENGSLVQISPDSAPQLVPTTYRHELSFLERPKDKRTFTYGEFDWLDGLGEGTCRHPIMIGVGYKTDKMQVLRWKPSKLGLIN